MQRNRQPGSRLAGLRPGQDEHGDSGPRGATPLRRCGVRVAAQPQCGAVLPAERHTQHAKTSKAWMAGIQPEHDVLSQVTNYTASLQRYREYVAMTLVTWPAMWAELSKPRWSNARFRLYGGKQRTVAKFWAETVRGAMARCNSAATGRPLALAYGAAGFSDAQGGMRVLLVDEFRTSRVSSARTNVVAGHAETFR
ncbi:hypothetical protein QJQ45_002025 [Haematococcus lacustris]|nr:hypothetical protein QJQ45_002025 [Haematococcus lacustris]